MPKAVIGHEEILKLLPHRHPILLVDRVLEVNDKEIVAEKLVSGGEPVLQGHFPGNPVFPGVYLLEAMAQTAGLWVVLHHPQHRGKSFALAGIDNARFRKPVIPGDVIELRATVTKIRGSIVRHSTVARVAGEEVAEAEIMAAIVDWGRTE